MTLATGVGGLTLGADGNVIAGHMTVTSQGISHSVMFHSDGSVDITPTGGEPTHLTEPAANDYCNL
jgi:hypothetical protein